MSYYTVMVKLFLSWLSDKDWNMSSCEDRQRQMAEFQIFAFRVIWQQHLFRLMLGVLDCENWVPMRHGEGVPHSDLSGLRLCFSFLAFIQIGSWTSYPAVCWELTQGNDLALCLGMFKWWEFWEKGSKWMSTLSTCTFILNQMLRGPWVASQCWKQKSMGNHGALTLTGARFILCGKYSNNKRGSKEDWAHQRSSYAIIDRPLLSRDK